MDESEKRMIEFKLKKFNQNMIYIWFFLITIWFAILFSYYDYIWFMTRITAMISYILFFATVSIGIVRKFKKPWGFLVKYHKSTAIWAFLFAISHIISVIFDKVKWGYQLDLWTYFGLNYSNEWFTYTSIGALAFILFSIVIITSIGKNMSRLGFKLWKNIHYLSYVGFILIQVHAFYLGTDFKYMFYSGFLYAISWFMLGIVTTLFGIRVIIGITDKLAIKKANELAAKNEEN